MSSHGKLGTIALKHFKYSFEDINYQFDLLTPAEQEIFENQETLDVIKREINAQNL
jgi:hypothetical protein